MDERQDVAHRLLAEASASLSPFLARFDRLSWPVFLHVDGLILYGNGAARALLAAPPELSLVGIGAQDLLADATATLAERLPRLAREALAAKVYQVTRFDGGCAFVEATSAPWVEVGGHTVLVTLGRDVTAQIEQAVGDARFRALFDSASDATLVVDSDGRVLLANPEAAALLGWSVEELSRMGVDALVPPDARAAHVGLRGEYQAAPVRRRMGASRSLEVVTASGALVPVEIALAPVSGPPGVGATTLVTLRDQRQRLAADAALRESEARYRGVVQGTTVGMFLSDLSGRYVEVNAAGVALTGYSREELLQLTVADLIPPGAPAPNYAARAPGDVWVARRQLLRKDGRIVPCEVTGNALPSGLVLGIARDLTETLRAEEALRQATRLDAVGRLAGGVAHDFNNLLTVVLSITDELELLVADRAEAAARTRELRETAWRAAAVIRQLLAFAREQPSRPRVVDLGAVVRDFRPMLERSLGVDHTLALILDPTTPRVFLDPAHLEQVLLNLAMNARDAMGRGGRLTVETRPEGEGALLRVSDTGCGMSEEVRAHLFEPFFTTKGERGTGLGLATVYGIVHQWDGAIAVESAPGAGTTFRIQLPASTRSETAGSEAPRHARAGEGERVLIVEDEPHVRQVVARVLDSAGYRTVSAANLDEAGECADAMDAVDVLVTDWELPRCTGAEVIERVRRRFPDVAVLVVSGHGVGRAGVGELVLPKPFSKYQLLDAVRALVEAPG